MIDSMHEQSKGSERLPIFRKLYDRRGIGNNFVSFDGRTREERVAISPLLLTTKRTEYIISVWKQEQQS